MKRRLTLNERQQELDNSAYFPEPETPPPAWSPLRTKAFWQKPSRWQFCMPRLKSVAKWAIFAILVVAACALYFLQPSENSILYHELEKEIIVETSEGNEWPWKEFPQYACLPCSSCTADHRTRHNGLVRGLKHFEICSQDGSCVQEQPQPFQYHGYKHMQEDVTEIIGCQGPRGIKLNESIDDAVWAYVGKAKGAVNPSIGSYEAAGLDGEVSFDRAGRFRAYGLDQFDNSIFDKYKAIKKANWTEVNWGNLQDLCVDANQHRFKLVEYRADNSIQYSNIRSASKSSTAARLEYGPSIKVKRTAILIRVWTGATWSADAVMNIRAMITEASLASGGKYQVFILLHVKDESIALFTGENQPQKTLRKNVPPEFHSITEVWNDAQTRSLYSNIADHAFVGRSPWMIVQWFARRHPEFDFFYQWEFDVRFTGHYLDFFEAVSSFGRKQPRKGIWERAGRLYLPAVHGDYDTHFRESTRRDDPHRVWGPVAVEGVSPQGPEPPCAQEQDQYEWGVGEDADWIGFLPSFNVTNTKWWFKDYLWGYAQGVSTPRRATLVAQGRVSKRVLELMNYENAENGHHMDAEMFPQSVCLHHGLKATSFPHPIFADRFWPSETLQTVFNGGPFNQAGGFLKSTFSKWNEDAWTNLTWYYSSGQAKPIFQRFLGIATVDTGGPEWEAANGHAVIRPMLLHPVKGAKAWHWTPEGWRQNRITH